MQDSPEQKKTLIEVWIILFFPENMDGAVPQTAFGEI